MQFLGTQVAVALSNSIFVPVTDPLRDMLQTTLGTAYTIERELGGGGGMSRVLVANETALDRTVVVKVMAPEFAAGVSAGRVEREVKLAARLQQANIVLVLSSGNSLPATGSSSIARTSGVS